MYMCVGLRRLSSVSTSDWITTISPHRLVYHPGLSNTDASMDFGCLLRSHFLLRNPFLLQCGLAGFGNTIFSSSCLSSSSSALRLFDFFSFFIPSKACDHVRSGQAKDARAARGSYANHCRNRSRIVGSIFDRNWSTILGQAYREHQLMVG